jgi:hypothetical protein
MLVRERLLKRFDLVHTGAFIEGDSLLCHALELCEAGRTREVHGSPSLQVVFTVHKILKPLVDMHVPVRVFWIGAHAAAGTFPSSAYRLLRQIVARDLDNTACDVQSLHFPEFHGPDLWELLMRKHAPEAVWMNRRMFPDAVSLFARRGIAVILLAGYTLRLDSEFVEVDVARNVPAGVAAVAEAPSHAAKAAGEDVALVGQIVSDLRVARAGGASASAAGDATGTLQEKDTAGSVAEGGGGHGVPQALLRAQSDAPMAPTLRFPEAQFAASVEEDPRGVPLDFPAIVFRSITIPAIASLLQRLIDTGGGRFRELAISHFWSLAAQMVLPLSSRRLKMTEGDEAGDTAPDEALFQSYHTCFCELVLGALHGTDTAVQSQDTTSVLNGADIWDGRFLAAVHRYREEELPDAIQLLAQFPVHVQDLIRQVGPSFVGPGFPGSNMPVVDSKRCRPLPAEFKQPAMIKGQLATHFFQYLQTGSWLREQHQVGQPVGTAALPPGWQAVQEGGSGETYYHNATSGKTSWTLPQPAAAAAGEASTHAPPADPEKEDGDIQSALSAFSNPDEDDWDDAESCDDAESVAAIPAIASRTLMAFAGGVVPTGAMQAEYSGNGIHDHTNNRIAGGERLPFRGKSPPTASDFDDGEIRTEGIMTQEYRATELTLNDTAAGEDESFGKTGLSEQEIQQLAETGAVHKLARIAGAGERVSQTCRTDWQSSSWQSILHDEGKFEQLQSSSVVLDYPSVEVKDPVLRAKYGLAAGMQPEAWQLRMLEFISARKSLLVVAPTSSGKTMSAELAMRMTAEKPSSSDRIAVFVQPTNALVRQTYATMVHAFGCDAVGMFTREHRQNVADGCLKCKVLVTNGACLELLLMQDAALLPRLDYLVIDEIHCIDEVPNGQVLERLLSFTASQAVQIPIIGLSATLSNAHQFYDWLVDIKQGEVELIIHKQRSTTLQFSKLDITVTDGKDGGECDSWWDDTTGAVSERPIPAMASSTINPLLLLPEVHGQTDVALHAFLESVPQLQKEQLLAIFKALHTRLQHDAAGWSPSYPPTGTLEAAVPDRVHSQYGGLIAVFRAQISDPHALANYHKEYADALGALRAEILSQATLSGRIWCDAVVAGALHSSGHDWYGGLLLEAATVPPPLADFLTLEKELELCSELRDSCLVHLLCRATTPLGIFDECRRTVLAAADSSLKYVLHLLVKPATDGGAACVARAVQQAMEDVGTATDDAMAPGRVVVSRSTAASYASIPIEHYAAATARHFMHSQETDDASTKVNSPSLIFMFSKSKIRRCVAYLMAPGVRAQWFCGGRGRFVSRKSQQAIAALDVEDHYKEALLFGVGVHSANDKDMADYLTLVEQMFGRSELKFVFATGSLSFGINMPCDNVIFAGGSTFLNGQLFWQCAGRAGRRGYGDGVGKIYFLRFEDQAIKRKLCRPLERLFPQCPITPAFMLRATNCCSQYEGGDSKHAGQVMDMMMQTLTRPLFEKLVERKEQLGALHDALAHSVLFAWSFLNERGYLRADGRCYSKVDLPLRLHYCYNIWVLADMLEELANADAAAAAAASDPGGTGLFALAAACRRTKNKRDDELELQLLRTLVCIISYSETGNESRKGTTLARPVPPQVLRAWTRNNSGVQAHFVRYMQQQASSVKHAAGVREDTEGHRLPLGSGGAFPPCPQRPCPQRRASELPAGKLPASARVRAARPLSGLEDWARRRGCDLRPPVARSAFASLAGCADDFHGSVLRMSMHAREGVFVSDACIPGKDPPVNVWRTMELVHQDGEFNEAVRTEDSGCRKRCEDFSSALRKVEASVRSGFAGAGTGALPERSWRVVRAFTSLKHRFDAQFKLAKNYERVPGFVRHEVGFVQFVDEKAGFIQLPLGISGGAGGKPMNVKKSRAVKFRAEDVYRGLELLTGSGAPAGSRMLPERAGFVVKFELWRQEGEDDEATWGGCVKSSGHQDRLFARVVEVVNQVDLPVAKGQRCQGTVSYSRKHQAFSVMPDGLFYETKWKNEDGRFVPKRNTAVPLIDSVRPADMALFRQPPALRLRGHHKRGLADRMKCSFELRQTRGGLRVQEIDQF